jgi:hypothetical protein
MVLTCNKITAESHYMGDFVTRVLQSDAIGNFVDDIARSFAARPNALLLASLTTIREAEKALLPDAASDLFTMLYVGREDETKAVREKYSKRFKS